MSLVILVECWLMLMLQFRYSCEKFAVVNHANITQGRCGPWKFTVTTMFN